MGKAILPICIFLNFMLCAAYGQRCETNEYYKKYFSSNSGLILRTSGTSKSLRDTNANEVIIVPVVIHVLYNTTAQNISDAQIISQLKSLNNDYRKLNTDAVNVPAAFAKVAADTKITFCIAKIDAFGKPTTGIVRKYTSAQSWSADDGMKFSAQGGDNAWDAKRYLNIWVCNLFGRSLGYSSLPGSQPEKDGVVIQYSAFGMLGAVTAPFNKGRTATHEIGHWLGLKHLWGDANCGNDDIADTPPQQNYNNGCPVFPHITSCSINGNGDMFMNFMDFTDDGCMNMFTAGQAIKMRSMFAAGAPRNTFLNSIVCDSNSVQRGQLPEDTSKTKFKILLYPNPALKYINIESKNPADIIGKKIQVYNIYGSEVISHVLSAQKNEIVVAQLSPGVYFIKIGEEKELSVIKFVKQ